LIITDEEHDELSSWVLRRQVTADGQQRERMILLSTAGQPGRVIAGCVGVATGEVVGRLNSLVGNKSLFKCSFFKLKFKLAVQKMLQKILFVTRDISSVDRFYFFQKDDYEVVSLFKKRNLLKIIFSKKIIITHPQRRFLWLAFVRRVLLKKNFFVQHGIFKISKETKKFPFRIFDGIFYFDKKSIDQLINICNEPRFKKTIPYGFKDTEEMQNDSWRGGVVLVTQPFNSSKEIIYWEGVVKLKNALTSCGHEFSVLIHPRLNLTDEIKTYSKKNNILIVNKCQISYLNTVFIGHYSTLLQTMTLAGRPVIGIRINDFLEKPAEPKSMNLLVSDFDTTSIITCKNIKDILVTVNNIKEDIDCVTSRRNNESYPSFDANDIVRRIREM